MTSVSLLGLTTSRILLNRELRQIHMTTFEKFETPSTHEKLFLGVRLPLEHQPSCLLLALVVDPAEALTLKQQRGSCSEG
jgi:hypothetical protein